MKGKKHIDYQYLLITAILTAVGLLIFFSAALGLHARSSLLVNSVIQTQLLGLGLGFIGLLIGIHLKLEWLERLALPLLGAAVLASLAVHIPGLGVTSGGAARWLDLGFMTVQPGEALKFAVIIAVASLLAKKPPRGREAKRTFEFKILSWLLLILGITALTLFLQPDMDGLFVIGLTTLALIMAQGNVKQFLAVAGSGLLGALLAIAAKPYIRERIMTFLSPAADPLGQSYQVQQSLIAIGSGGLFGRGFGQSIQKFNFLPEPIGDSIFAVAAEEWGFVGAAVIIILFVVLAWRGLVIAKRAGDSFYTLLAIGITFLIIIPAFINIASMLSLFPLSGLTLPLISKGGTSLLLTLTEIGIMLNISKQRTS